MRHNALRKANLLLIALLAAAVPPFLAGPASAESVTKTVNWSFSHTGPLPNGWTYFPAKGCTDPSNVWLQNGEAVLRVGEVGTHPYCGAKIGTERTFNPPFVISVRARFALPSGVHTGATLYGADGDPWPSEGEADLDEMTAKTPTKDHVRLWTQDTSVSWPKRCGEQADPDGVDLSSWHVYTTSFGVETVTFSLDGTPFFTTSRTSLLQDGCTWPFNQSAGLRVFLTAAAGGWGGTPQGPGYPALQEFDYVRVTPLSS
jgi:hypothetical protein